MRSDSRVTPAQQFYCCVAALTSECLCLIYTNTKPESKLMYKAAVPIRIQSAEIMSSDDSAKRMKAVYCAVSMLLQTDSLTQSLQVCLSLVKALPGKFIC